MKTTTANTSGLIFRGLAVAVCLLLALYVAAASPASGQKVTITIDGSSLHQKMDGFGSGFGGFETFERGHFDEYIPVGVSYRTDPQLRRTLIEVAVRELGVSHLRLWLSQSIERKNDNDDPQVMNWNAFTWKGDSGLPQSPDFRANRQNGIVQYGEFLREAVPLGLTNWILTPGRMEDWLHECFDKKDSNRFEEYAEWAAAHVLYLKKTYGFEAPYWSMFNEPDMKGWKSPDLWIQWIKATGRRFRKEGLKTKIMFPDNASVFDAVEMVKGVMKDEEVRRYIGALAYHHYYSSGKGPQPFLTLAENPEQKGELFEKVTGGIRAMAELGRLYRLPSWQTESAYYPQFTKGLSEWDVGLGRANEIHYELVCGASAVAGMSMIASDAVDYRYQMTMRHNGHHIVMRTDGQRVDHWEITRDGGAVFAHYGRFVRPGDQRIAAGSSEPMLHVTAFVANKGRRYVAVAINNSAESKNAVFELNNLAWRPEYAAGFLTDAGRMLADFPVVRQGNSKNYEVVLPPKSLATIVWSQEKIGGVRGPLGGDVAGKQ
jgi:O-glycosyl hydrolase